MATPSAGPITSDANIGIWLLERISMTPVPPSQFTTAALHSSGVEEKRWKCSWSILTTWSASCERPVDVAVVVDAVPDDVRCRPPRAAAARPGAAAAMRVDDRRQRLVLDLDQLGGVARQLARLGEHDRDRVALVADLVDREAVLGDPRRRAPGRSGRTAAVSSLTSPPVSVA